MRLLILVATLVFLMFSPDFAAAQPDSTADPTIKPNPDANHVRRLLSGFQFKDEQFRPLLELEEAVFPAFEAILKDAKSDPQHVRRVFLTLARMKGDTRRFVLLSTEKLSDEDEGVRRLAAALLEKIGTERDTPPLIALLSDEEVTVQHQAAKTLVAIGGKRDLIAMDAWLKKGSGGNRHADSLRHVKECRDALELRLKESPMPKNLKD